MTLYVIWLIFKLSSRTKPSITRYSWNVYYAVLPETVSGWSGREGTCQEARTAREEFGLASYRREKIKVASFICKPRKKPFSVAKPCWQYSSQCFSSYSPAQAEYGPAQPHMFSMHYDLNAISYIFIFWNQFELPLMYFSPQNNCFKDIICSLNCFIF